MSAKGGNYKFSSLKVFGSNEFLYKNEKKYRIVYDASECRYLYAELAMYNKLFDEEQWTANAKLICTNVNTGEQLCELTKSLEVTTDMNMIYIREGWGTPDPGWWKRGYYRWSAFIEDVKVGEVYFYVVDRGLLTNGVNPYFDIVRCKMFESPRNGMNIDERVYLKTFAGQTTRYINIEMELKLKNPEKDFFPLEFQFNFYNDAGQHKAYMEYFISPDGSKETIIIDTGFGSEGGGYWFDDKYTIEAVFMDTLIAVVPFEVGAENEEAQEFPFMASRDILNPPTTFEDPNRKPTFEEATADLNQLIGLGAVKKEMSEFATYLQFLKIRKEKGIEENSNFNLHTVFTGNPGTGKTTVAKMLGKIYHSLDLLSKGEVHEVGRVDLVGEYIGQTAPKVKKAIDKARGGILFIDEAYALSDRGDDGKDFGKEVIEVLLKEMSDGKGDIAIIFAGYPKEMQAFIGSNPGLASRISKTIHFPDYTPEELLEIADYAAGKSGVIVEAQARELLYKKVVEAYRTRDTHFGNARFVNGIVEEAKQNMALRLMRDPLKLSEMSKDDLSTLNFEDMSDVFGLDTGIKVDIPIDEALLKDSLSQLHELVGLSSVKTDVDEMVKLVRYYREIGKDVRKAFSIHTVFTGNPGTGKTTVARLLVRIYKALGILERGQLVECDRKSLVAGFLGQTAIKTAEMIDKSIGGGLFIDEAYALSSGGDDYGREAIETLLKRMEDQRGEFMVIVAGYPKEMQRFLEANPGLMSRFDKQLHFEDYSIEELVFIAETMFDDENLKMDAAAKEHIFNYVQKMLNNKHKYFGNARTVRKIVAEAIRKQNLRLASLSSAERSPEMIRLVTFDDVKDFALLEQAEEPRKGIGF